MKRYGHDRTAIGAILLGTAGALALSMLFFARAESPQVPVTLEVADEPTFTPYEVAPRMTNRLQGLVAAQREYPALLREAGIGGSVQVWFLIDERGVVQETGFRERSGHAQLDAAALAVAGLIEFTPARNRGKDIPVWISLPIAFRAH